MANLPRFGRRQRLPVAAPPVPAAAQPAAEPKPEILAFALGTQTLQPLEPNPAAAATATAPASPLITSPPRLPSPAKNAMSPSASPKYGASVTRVASPPPFSPANKYSDWIIGQTVPAQSPEKSRRATSPPLSPLALPRTQVTSGDGTAAQHR